MSLINRDLSQSIIVDKSQNSDVLHPEENAIDCSSFIDDPNDRDQIGACLVWIKDMKDVCNVCTQWRDLPGIDIKETLSPEY